MVKEVTSDDIDAMADDLFERGKQARISGDYASAAAMLRTGMRMMRSDIDLRREKSQLARDNAALQEEAETDALTGVPNRKGFYRFAQQELAESMRFEELVVALACVDLDGFKKINDTFGHDAGDELLKEVTRRLQEAFRDTDIVCRVGGDELFIILPYKNKSDFNPEEIAHKIREALADLYLWDDGKPSKEGEEPRTPDAYPIGASIGISSSNEPQVFNIDSPERKMELMSKIADQRMYQDKWRDGKYTDADREELFHPKNSRLEALRVKGHMHHEGVTINGPFDLEI